GQFTGTGAFVLQPAAGGTLFTWREHFKPPLGPLGELGFMLIVGPHLRRVFTKSMENVKHLAESSNR
ncbi:MAG TPA: SRPBCC family protein, partial [Dehalococcoidia bacterium]|nr:SRPBCC family protein [Dehalococcoidia bacterium]